MRGLVGLGIREGRDDQLDRAAAMPHRSTAGDNRLDARLECTVGRLYFDGRITEAQHNAGLKYGNLMLEYLESIEAPSPYGGNSQDYSDDSCYHRNIVMAQAREILRVAAKRSGLPSRDVILAVDRVAIYEESPPNDADSWKALRIGLSALAGEG